MKIIIDGPQFAEAIQKAEWVVEAEGLEAVVIVGEQLRQHFEAGIVSIKGALDEIDRAAVRLAAIIDTAFKHIDLYDDNFVKHLYRPKQISWSASLQKVADSQGIDIEKLIRACHNKSPG